MTAAVEFSGVGRAFPGVKALDDLSVRVETGTVHGFLGGVGAGKSVLLRILCGLDPGYTGTVRVLGEKVRFHTPGDALRHGILSHVQIPAPPAPYLTAAEWMVFGCEPMFGPFIRRRKLYRTAETLLWELNAAFHANDDLRELSPGQLDVLSMAGALYRQSVKGGRVAALDEPAAACNLTERRSVFDAVRRLKERGVTILYATRSPDEITELCDRVSVLRDGVCVRTADVMRPDAASRETQHISLSDISGNTHISLSDISGNTHISLSDMSGNTHISLSDISGNTRVSPPDVSGDVVTAHIPAAAFPPRKSCARNAVVLKAEHLTGPDSRDAELVSGAAFHDAGFVLHDREILGFYGLSGAGCVPLARALAGLLPFAYGTVSIRGRSPVRSWNAPRAYASGIALMGPSDETPGFCASLNNAENLLLSDPGRARTGLFLNRGKLRQAAAETLRVLDWRSDHTADDSPYTPDKSSDKSPDNVPDKSPDNVPNKSPDGARGDFPGNARKVSPDNVPDSLSAETLDLPTAGISGVEQLRIAWSRSLSHGADILIFDRPARGLHTVRRRELYRMMEQLPERGCSLILVSDDWEEIAELCDRVIVMRGGEIVAVRERRELDAVSLPRLARDDGASDKQKNAPEQAARYHTPERGDGI